MAEDAPGLRRRLSAPILARSAARTGPGTDATDKGRRNLRHGLTSALFFCWMTQRQRLGLSR
jgi:hypothetical protein